MVKLKYLTKKKKKYPTQTFNKAIIKIAVKRAKIEKVYF